MEGDAVMAMETRKVKSGASVGPSHIRSSILLHIAVSSLLSKKFRGALTIAGVAIGTGSVFLLLAFGMGLQNLVTNQVMKGQSINTIDVTTTGSRMIKMDQEKVADIVRITNVESASGFYAKASKLTVGGAAADVVVYGVDTLYLQTSEFVMVAGKMVDPNSPEQVAVSSSILEAAGVTDYAKMIGTTVTVKVRLSDEKLIEKKLRVVGVVSSNGGSEAFVSPKIFSENGVTGYAGIKVLANDRQHVPQIRHAIESLGYDTMSPIDTLEQVDQFFKILSVVLVSIGAIGMVIAILGMINTLAVSLLERTKEVALMLALGARPRDVRSLFIDEAVILALAGGVLGIVSATAISFAVDAVLNQLARSKGATAGFTVFSMPLWLVGVMLLAMVAVGYVVAYLPARRAARINSIEVLRRD